MRAIFSAGCVPFLGPTSGFFEWAAPPGGRSSLWKFSRQPEGGYEEVRRRSPERADRAVVALGTLPITLYQPPTFLLTATLVLLRFLARHVVGGCRLWKGEMQQSLLGRCRASYPETNVVRWHAPVGGRRL